MLAPHRTSVRSRRAARLATIAAGTVAAAAMTVVSAPGASAAPRTVDPATTTPTLNPSFAPYTCWEAGGGIICKGSLFEEWQNEAIGLECDGRPVYSSGYERANQTRWHDAEGRAVKTTFHANFREEFSLSATGDGPTFTLSGNTGKHYTYAVPGDRTTRTLTQVGANFLGRSGDGGPLLVKDVGVVVFAPGQEEDVVVSQHGTHDFYDDPTVIDRAICDALT